MEVLDLSIIVAFIVIIAISEIYKYICEKNNKENNIGTKIDDFCNEHYKKVWLVFALIIFITVIYKFGDLPTYIGVDEAGMAYDSYCLANYGTDRYMNSYPLYLINFGGGQSALCSYICAIFVKLIGFNRIAFRLPVLLIYLLGTVASYLLVSKTKDKKTALLFTFLILTCPWNIMNARQALDCNLYAGLLMIDLYFMNKATKNYQYVMAGICVGLTLYTYCLSWITMPIFLAVWAIYMLYLKKIDIKKLIIFAIPIIIFALPLIYFLLVNYGIVEETQIGIFTIPMLTEFRENEIGISNIWKNGLENIKTIFLYKNTIYLVYVPLFIIGYIISLVNTFKELRKKEYSITSVIVIAFTTIFIGLMFTRIPTPNKANVLYLPILYFVTIAILEICKKIRGLLLASIICITILFVNFEYNYYTNYATNENMSYYEDTSLVEISKILEENNETKHIKKCVMTFNTAQYIYPLIENPISPYEFKEDVETKTFYISPEVTRVGEYYYYNYYYNANEIKDLDYSKDYIFIVSTYFSDVCEYIESKGYKKQLFGDLYIFTSENINIEL